MAMNEITHGCMTVRIGLAVPAGNVNIAAAGRGMTVRVALVCESKKYLSVEPEYIWLVPENMFADDVNVLTNSNWQLN